MLVVACGGRIAPLPADATGDAGAAADTTSEGGGPTAPAAPCRARGIELAVSTPPTLSLMTFSPDTLAVTTEGTIDTGDLLGDLSALAVERDGGVAIAIGDPGAVHVGMPGASVGSHYGILCWLDAHLACRSSRVSFDYANLDGVAFAGGADGGPETLFGIWLGRPLYTGPAIGPMVSDGGSSEGPSTIPIVHAAPLALPAAYPQNLTAAGDGRLFIWSHGAIEQVDPTTGATTSIGGAIPDSFGSCPMAFWAGDLYLFRPRGVVSSAAPPDGAAVTTTVVIRYAPRDGSMATVAEFPGQIGAAGVSTCAPLAP
jgi:hypothetical protein